MKIDKLLDTKKDCRSNKKSHHCQKGQSPLMFSLVVICLTSVVGYRFYNQPKLYVGTKSPETIIAPRDGKFENKQATEQKRQEARTGSNPILRVNPEITGNIEESLNKVLDKIEVLRQTAGVIPFAPTNTLSTTTQQYLRNCSQQEWQIILNQLKQGSNIQHQQKVMTELLLYRQQVTQEEFQSLIKKIANFRREYARIITNSSEQSPSVLSVYITTELLNLDQPTWEKTKTSLSKKLNQILIQGIPPGITSEHLSRMIDTHLSDNLVPLKTQVITSKLLQKVLENEYNLEIDQEATTHRAEESAKAITPQYVEIKKGEIIVRQGKKISQEDFVLLDGFQLSRRGIDWGGIGQTAVLVSGSVLVFYFLGKRLHHPLRRRDYILLCLLSISTPLLTILKFPYTNLPGLGLLVSSFYGPTLAVTQIILMTGLTCFATDSISGGLMAGAAGGLLAAALASRMRSRDGLAMLGGGVGLVQGGAYYISHLIVSASPKTVWFTLLPETIFAGLSGTAWSVISLGISPYLERLFDLVTPIRLIELSNPNCPLLKRLATETPGTFQHTLLVACLAEAAARKLHCNVELVRAGTLYHDIGKMHDPLGFIENQMGRPNKHDEINDPYQSATIIKKHVSEGIVMARKYGLPRVIRDFIPEHQGTLLIAYFYYQAKQKAAENGQETVSEDDFRYDGPIPQSRETGIVMLADGCEAALRSLKDATPEIAMATIQKIFQARWRDNQLQDSGISLEELPIIADVFVQVWQQFHHQRIAYPKAALEPQGMKN